MATILKKEVKILFRLNPHVQTFTHQYIQTSHEGSKFGESIYDEQKIDEIVQLYKNNQYVHLVGFHSHIGSQIKSVQPYLELTKKMVSFIYGFEIKYNMRLEVLNLGGGFGIRYVNNADTLFD